MTFRKRADEARRRIVELIDAAGDETSRRVREECLAIFDRWLAGGRVDLTREFSAANPTARDSIVEPLLIVLQDLRLI